MAQCLRRLLLVVWFGVCPCGPAQEPAAAEPPAKEGAQAQSIVWEVDNLKAIGGQPASAEGGPQVIATDRGPAVSFDGQDDAIFLETNALEGCAAFTVEALFRPAADGPHEQRFFHVQETDGESRVLLELRVVPGGLWYADTFIRAGRKQCALVDPKLTHPCDQWHTLALVCDGKQMTHYVNGVKELARGMLFAPLGKGRTSLGVRLNRVSWFKGTLRRIRITPRALTPEELLRP
jgi:hypothetical protein